MDSIVILGVSHDVEKPSLAVALDLVSMWADTPSRAHMGRLCAAALGVSCPSLKLPKYSFIDAEPLAYGGRCLERLLSRGVHAGDVYSAGVGLIVMFADALPKEEGVEAAKKP